MVKKCVIHYFIAVGLFVEGVTGVIITQQTVVAAVGGDAQLSCQLDNKNVVQVTWQKVLPKEDKNMASYSENWGQRVNRDFREKVEFKEAELHKSSIVIRNVSEQDEGCYLCLFNTYPDGSVRNKTCLLVYGVIITQQTVVAAVGGDAQLSCQLLDNKNVVQVTWQKVLPKEDKNMASYSENWGQRVNLGFREKVEFIEAELHKSSIVIRNVSEQDEGCYLCLFNTYPDGSVRNKTCLQVNELHEPVLHVEESKSPEETRVSCSATGRPAPTVTLTASQHPLYSHNTVSVNNTNGTVTVTTTALLSGFHGNSTQVGCAAGAPSGPQKDVFMMIPGKKQRSVDGLDKKSGSNQRSRWTLIIIIPLMVGFVALLVVIFIRVRSKTQNRDTEVIEMSSTLSNDSKKTEEPLKTSESKELRQRTSPERNGPSERREASTSTSRRPEFNTS
ncbi:nectin-1-like [Cololabis saira]|uniref:nectin-1-like n=1 Tax=Cololabis saira TaxID=129043 RepID=UPI002AD4AAFA|nr:nectin-1-like [Cololabis saira]